MTRPVRTDWPLVGRAEELAAILDGMEADGGSGVMLAGPAGVGKTRLAREVLTRVADAGAATTWAAATRATSPVPFGALTSLLPERLPPTGDRLTLFRLVARHLVEKANGAPSVVVIDDAHLLDEAGAGLIHQLAVTGQVRLLLSVRSGERVPEPIRTVWKDGLVERVELAPLSRSEVGTLLTQVLGGHVDRATVDRIWSITRGNPLFLRELVLDTAGAEGFDVVDSIVLWQRPLRPGQRLDDLLTARLGDASPAGRGCARVLALGEPLGLSVLERLSSPAALLELENRGLVRIERQQRRTTAQLVHPLYGEVLRSQLAPLEGRHLRRRLAVALADAGVRRGGDGLRLATLELDADLVPPADRALGAAREANRACDYQLAERLARTVLATGATSVPLSLAFGEALNGQERHAEADAILAAAEGLSPDDSERVRIAEQRALALHWGLGRPEDARDVLDAAERSIADRSGQHYLQAVRASSLTSSNRHQDALTVARPLLADAGVDEVAQLRALVPVASALSVAGRTTESMALCDRMLEPALRHADDVPLALGWVVAQRLLASIIAGRLDEAERLAQDAYGMAMAERDDEVRGGLAMALGRIDLQRGRLERAALFLREGAALLRLRDRDRYRSWCLSVLAQVFAQRGDAATAAAIMDEVDAAASPGVDVSWTDVELGRSWAAVAGGDADRGQRGLLDAAAEAGRGRMVVPEAVLLHEAQRTGAPAALVADRLAELTSGVESDYVTVWAAHARTVADGDPLAISAVAHRFEAMGANLLAAEAWADAAVAARTEGALALAKQARARCEVLVATCAGARTPLLSARAATVALTRREGEIVRLAADGWSSRAIAEHLVLSERTVDGHLGRAYRKLGVAGRQDLAPLLHVREHE